MQSQRPMAPAVGLVPPVLHETTPLLWQSTWGTAHWTRARSPLLRNAISHRPLGLKTDRLPAATHAVAAPVAVLSSAGACAAGNVAAVYRKYSGLLPDACATYRLPLSSTFSAYGAPAAPGVASSTRRRRSHPMGCKTPKRPD